MELSCPIPASLCCAWSSLFCWIWSKGGEKQSLHFLDSQMCHSSTVNPCRIFLAARGARLRSLHRGFDSLALKWGCCCWEGVLGAAVLDFLGNITFHSREKSVYRNNLGFVSRKIDKDTQSRVRQGSLWENLAWIKLLLFKVVFGA